MAEHGPPRNGIIFFFVILSVATLVMLKPVFDAYYDGMYRGAIDDRLETYDDTVQLREVQAEWNNELGVNSEDGAINRAMATLSGPQRPAAVAPQQPDEMNLDPLRGWNQLPQEVPEPPTPPEPEDLAPEEVPTDALDIPPDDGPADDSPTADDAPAPDAAPTPPTPRRRRVRRAPPPTQGAEGAVPTDEEPPVEE